MNDIQVLTISALGVFMIVMGALVYVMTRDDQDNE